MRIDRKLNLVFPVDTANGTVYVHSAPISREVFEQHHEVLGKTYVRLVSEGLVFNARKHAALTLRAVAKDTFEPGRRDSKGRPLASWDGPDGVERGLFPEIRRLTNVIMPGPDGYEAVPYDVALAHGKIDADDAASIDGLVAFFTVASAEIDRQEEREQHFDFLKSRWSAEVTSLNCSEWAGSLTASTAASPSTTAAASAPSSTILPQRDSGNSSAIPI